MESSASQENPFRLPPDDEIFLMREQERQRRQEERARVKTMRAMDKTTSSSRRMMLPKLERFGSVLAHSASAPTLPGGGDSSGAFHAPKRDKDNIAEFIAKKREMFLVQMSLDVKKAEILKLDEKGRMKEEALRKSQAMLDEDVTRFDTFLQANDAKAHKAMKQAEDMTKRKQERQQRIKQLRGQISAIASEISKHKEQREECVKYKRFLDRLTPQEWTDRQVEAKKERRRLRRVHWVEARLDEIARKVQMELDAEEAARQQAEREAGVKKVRSKKKQESEEQLALEEEQREKARKRIRRRYPTQQQVEREYVSEDSGEELPLYFERPSQLLGIFQNLEEQNLFLIQNSQETEQALEEVEHQFQETKRVMGTKAASLKEQIATFEKTIEAENQRCEELRQRAAKASGENQTDQFLAQCGAETLEVHKCCGYEADRDPDTLQMLAQIEAKLEELLTTFDEAEQDPKSSELLSRLEKEKEKERRERVKKQRMELQLKKNEERLKASLLRSQAPVHKKLGKQIMFRSAPLHQEKKVVVIDEEAEVRERDTKIFGLYIERNGIPNCAITTAGGP